MKRNITVVHYRKNTFYKVFNTILKVFFKIFVEFCDNKKKKGGVYQNHYVIKQAIWLPFR